jgi:hypothetical protein
MKLRESLLIRLYLYANYEYQYCSGRGKLQPLNIARFGAGKRQIKTS